MVRSRRCRKASDAPRFRFKKLTRRDVERVLEKDWQQAEKVCVGLDQAHLILSGLWAMVLD